MNSSLSHTAEPSSGTVPGETAPATFAGELRCDSATYSVWLRFASKYSLWLQYSDARPEQPTGAFDCLLLKTESGTAQTGQCRVIHAAAPAGEYRVVALEDIHDFEKLLFQDRVDVLDNAARNLPLILGYKRNIRPEFREYVAEVSYDLSVYRTLFDGVDDEYRSEPQQVAELVQQGLIERLGKEFTACLNGHVERMQELTADFTSSQHHRHGYYMRKQFWSSLLCAPFTARSILKPRGYIGDSEMMRMCYRDAHEGNSTFGRIMHKYPVSTAAAEAVRNRRELVPRFARALAERAAVSGDGRIKLLSVACGPATELNGLFRSPDDTERFHCSLLDQDQQALLEAESVVDDVQSRLQRTLSVDFMRESVRTLLSTRALQKRWGSFHFIYSMALFDYLNPRVAEAVLKKLYALLLPDGELAIGNFHNNNPTRLYMDYWLDWPMFYRSEDDLVALAAALEGAETWVEYDASGVQMLLRIRKPVS